MEPYETPRDSSVALTFEQLTLHSLDTAVELCDQYVGKNLYPKAYLSSVMEDPAHHFYLLMTPEREVVGYIYFELTNLEALAALSKLPIGRLAVISQKKDPVVGNLRSISVAAAYRHQKHSAKLVRFYLEQLQAYHADAAFGVFWKPNGVVPMEKTLKEFDFLYLADSHRVWYDNGDLVCPFCKGPCECDAAIYYKTLRKESET